jgi:hypothetical protein
VSTGWSHPIPCWPQPHRVYGEAAEVLLDLNNQTVVLLLSELARGTDDLLDQRRELHGLRIELELPGLDLREVGHLVDEAEQVGAGAMHPLPVRYD